MHPPPAFLFFFFFCTFTSISKPGASKTEEHLLKMRKVSHSDSAADEQWSFRAFEPCNVVTEGSRNE